MRLLRNLEDLDSEQGCVLSIGNFDGVHRGHRVLLEKLVSLAHTKCCPAVVLTFDPHPLKLLKPDFDPPRLTTLEHKAALIGASGVDRIVAYPTDQALLNLTAEEFFQKIVIDKFHATGIVEGPNFFFGKDRTGDIVTLQKQCNAHALELLIVEPDLNAGQMVSSSTVREAIQQGNVGEASCLLGRFFSITGVIETGAQRGRTIGFPTANLSQVQTLLPANGVYAATCSIDDRTYAVALNIGPNPTFRDGSRKIEAHLLDFSGDLYGREISLMLIDRIRAITTFENVDALKQQVGIDINKIRDILDEQRFQP